MKLIYVHHAERDVSSNVEKQEQDITEAGMKEAFLLAEKLKQLKVTAIYTSPYLRCKHTAEILNQYIQVPIYEESRFNEKDKNESWREFQERNMEAIDDLVILIKRMMILLFVLQVESIYQLLSFILQK